MSVTNKDGLAPTFCVADTSIVVVEHPCVVQNVENAIDMLGGPGSIAECLEPEAKSTLGLKFDPRDPASRAVISINKPTSNILLKVQIPRRTGRKRKRGSDDPYVQDADEGPLRRDARYLRRSLRDNSSTYRVELLGNISSTHLWRSMPDFVYSTHGSTFFQDLKTKISSQDYPTLQQWSLPHTPGVTNNETFPPPVLSTVTLPNNYAYRQNPAVKTVADPTTGKATLQNSQAPQKLFTHQVQHDDEAWPDEVHPKAVPLAQQPANLQKIARHMRALFDERPIWSRRALLNNLPDDAPFFLAKYAVTYTAFAVRSGPWRDTLVKLGVDPRTDRSYRKYQSVLIQLMSKDPEMAENREDFARSWARSKDKTSHIFTGKSGIPPDGKVWQLCDLEDPQLKALVDCPDVYIRAECETRYFGWYANGTMAKIRVALKAKADAFVAGDPLDGAALQNFLKLPERWSPSGPGATPDPAYLPKSTNKEELEWASAYRSICRTLDGRTPLAGGSGKGRLSKKKPTARPSLLEENEDDMGEKDTGGYDDPEKGDAGLSE